MSIRHSCFLFLILLAPELLAQESSYEQYLAAGGRALASGELEAASTAFEAARDLDSQAPLAWLGLAEVAERRGETLGALKLAQSALERSPEKVAALKVVSRLQISLGAPREALASLERLRRAAPADPLGYLSAAALLRDIQRGEQAVDLLREALEKSIESAELVAQLGLLLLERGAAEEAGRLAEKALERWPEQAGLELVLGLARLGDPARRSEAVPWLERALEHGAPQQGKIHLALGESKLDGCQEAANEHFRRAVELLPQLPEAHYKLATGLRACGDATGARAALKRFRALSQQVDDADHRRRRIGAALNEVQRMTASGDLDAALDRLDDLVAESPDDDRIFTLRGKLLFSAGRPERALTSVRRAQALMPSRVEGYYLEGLFLSQGGKLDEATRALERALAIDPERFEALKLQAAVVAELGQLESAADLFERALRAGEEAVVHLAYARVLAALGRDAESEREMTRYRELRGE